MVSIDWESAMQRASSMAQGTFWGGKHSKKNILAQVARGELSQRTIQQINRNIRIQKHYYGVNKKIQKLKDKKKDKEKRKSKRALENSLPSLTVYTLLASNARE